MDRDASGQIDKEELREMFGKAGTIITDSQVPPRPSTSASLALTVYS